MPVMTVTGPIEARSLGHVQVHEHLLCDLSRVEFRSDLDGLLDNVEVMAEEVAAYHAAGGGTIVEVSPEDLGRDPLGLRLISERSGVPVVMGCGLYRGPFYPEWVDTTPTAEIARRFIRELDEGVGETGVRPGLIGEVGAHKKWITGREERVIRAAAKAQAARGVGFMTHTHPGGGLEQLEIIRESGADLRRVAIGHCDNLTDLDYHLAILATGAYVSFDSVGLRFHSDEWRAQRIAELVRAGHGRQILLSSNIASRNRLRHWGGPGYGFLLQSFTPLLRANGLDEDAMRLLTVINPARFLSGEELG